MRYYSLSISNPDSGLVYTLPQTGSYFDQFSSTGPTFASFYDNPITGQVGPNPGALNIEFNATVVDQGTPQGKTIIRVWGVGLGMLSNATQLSGLNFELSAGMAAGLPLATAAFNDNQQGVVLKGQVIQAFGNWQGTNQTLDLLCLAGAIEPTGGIFFQWDQGTSLVDAISGALRNGFSGYNFSVNVLDLVAPSPQAGWFPDLPSFAESLNALTQLIGPSQGAGQDYGGTITTVQLNTIYIFDKTQNPQKTKQLKFQDLIGQPTWLGPAIISFKTVLRGDLNLGDQVIMPTDLAPPYVGSAPTIAVPNAPIQSKVLFQNSFVITEVSHFANFRQPDADAWSTAFLASPVAPS